MQALLSIPVQGSIALFLVGTALHLFATTSLGIFLGTVARSMPQFGLLFVLVLLPMQMLSGGQTPRESMPELVQHLMLVAPTTHYVMLAQAILFCGAGIEVVWVNFIALAAIGGALLPFRWEDSAKLLANSARLSSARSDAPLVAAALPRFSTSD